MIQEITLTKRVQTPTPPNAWCYQNQGDNYYRYFTDRVLLGHDAEPWPECTDEEKVQWEEEHKEPEPSPEPVDQPIEKEE